MEPALDIDALRALVLVADYRSFTRTAEALETTQAAISLRLKRLETRIGRRLLERTPRLVQLTPDGAALVTEARHVLAAHDAALASLQAKPQRPLQIGISDQAVGAQLPGLLAQLRGRLPGLRLEVRIGLSRDLSEAFDAGRIDAAILHHVGGPKGARAPRGAELLLKDRLGWFAAPGFSWSPAEALPLLALASPCTVRAAAIKALDGAKIRWSESYTGGGVVALTAAVQAGLGIAVLGRRASLPGMMELTRKQRLPDLPETAIVLQSRVSDPVLSRALREIASAIRADQAP
ncbi:MAG: LysR substrate-binding domain-containing protein [Ferrovibrio sp.]